MDHRADTDAGCRFSLDDNLVFPYGLWGKVMGWVGEKMAKKSTQQVLREHQEPGRDGGAGR